MLMIWNLMEPLTKCDNPCVQKNHTGCSLFGSPSSKPDGVAHNLELSKSLTKCDSPCVQKNHTGCSLFGSPSSKADRVAHDLETKQIVDKM